MLQWRVAQNRQGSWINQDLIRNLVQPICDWLHAERHQVLALQLRLFYPPQMSSGIDL